MLNSTKTWQEEKLDELVRDLCSVEFRVKSATRKRLEQFIFELLYSIEKDALDKIPVSMKRSRREVINIINSHRQIYETRRLNKI